MKSLSKRDANLAVLLFVGHAFACGGWKLAAGVAANILLCSLAGWLLYRFAPPP